MTGKDIFMAVGQVDDRFIAELMEEKPARRRTAVTREQAGQIYRMLSEKLTENGK